MRWGTLVLAVALGIGLCGCEAAALLPYARELEDMTLVRTLGVDKRTEGGVQVTAASGAQSGGRGEAGHAPVVIGGTGARMSAACLGMQGAGSSHLFFGHVGQLLLGEKLAEAGAEETLDYVLRDVELRLDTNLFIVKGGTAGAAIGAAAEGEHSAAQRLDSMEDSGGAQPITRTVSEVMADLARNGSSFVPALTEGLETAGYAILKEGALAGWVTGDGAAGVNLLLGRVVADVAEVEANGLSATLRVVGASTAVRPVFEGEKLAGLEITCRVDANLAEADGKLNLRENTTWEACAKALAEMEKGRIEAALAEAKALDADFLDLEKRAGLAAPWHWAALQNQWALATLSITVAVEGNILRSYDVER